MNLLFLENAVTRSEYYKCLGESAIKQLSEEDIHFVYHIRDNNISALVKHISGNLLSSGQIFKKVTGKNHGETGIVYSKTTLIVLNSYILYGPGGGYAL